MAGSEGVRGLERIAALLGATPERIRQADRRAQGRAAKKAKVIASRRIRENLALKKQYVDGKLRIRRVQENAIHLEATRRGMLLTRFPHKAVFRTRRGKKRPAGYRVRIKRGGKSVHMRHIFPIRLLAGRVQGSNIGLATRLGRERYPIKVLHGPSVSQALETLLEEIGGETRGHYARFVEAEIGKI